MNSLDIPKSAWYNVQSIFSKVWFISEGNVYMYLIEGEERALLIDTGWGFANLPAFIASITTLPLVVINTHGHPDHAGGNYRFNKVLIHEKDVPLAEIKTGKECRVEELNRFISKPLPKEFSKDSWINSGVGNLVSFNSSFSLDLGGRLIDILELPGHTPGSICLYDRSEKLLFTGDSICKGNILLHFDTSPPLSTFLTGVNRLAERINDIRFLLPAHNKVPLTSAILLEFKAGIEKVLSGELTGKPHTTFLGSGLLAKFASCGFLYNKDNLF